MKKILFACDLDNTLIHSHKLKAAGDICVEIYDGKEQSFISSRAVELLKEIAEKILFVPVTTRSIEQYRRITWLEGTKPEFAVTSNGANLLHFNEIDKIWRQDFYKFIQPYSDEIKAQKLKLSQDENFTICKIVDGSFLFLKCSADADKNKLLAELQANTNLVVQNFGLKIYLFPPKLNKGDALLKLKEIFNPEKTFAAGDSGIDIPMLNVADVAFAHRDLKFQHENLFEFDSADFLAQIAEKTTD